MTAGIQPSQSAINQQAGNLVLQARNTLQQIMFFNDYLQSLGQQGLVDLQFTTEDATTLLTVYADLAAYANAAMGEAYDGPALPFDFFAATIPLWGGN